MVVMVCYLVLKECLEYEELFCVVAAVQLRFGLRLLFLHDTQCNEHGWHVAPTEFPVAWISDVIWAWNSETNFLCLDAWQESEMHRLHSRHTCAVAAFVIQLPPRGILIHLFLL
jgi:hypothetical protein